MYTLSVACAMGSNFRLRIISLPSDAQMISLVSETRSYICSLLIVH